MILRLACLALILLSATACSSPGGSCEQRKADGASLIQDALASPSVTQCQADTDCILQDTNTRCSASCGSVTVSKSGAATLAAAVANADALCGTGCTAAVPPCPFGNEFAVCAGGKCALSPTAPGSWVSIAMEQATNAGTSVPLTCDAGGGCTLWTLTPDGAISVSESGVVHQATLSAAHLQTVNGIVQGIDFRLHVSGQPWPCAAASGVPFVTLDASYTTATVGMDVTGCVQVGPPGNGAQQLFQVLSAY
jgi:hypothetical protein